MGIFHAQGEYAMLIWGSGGKTVELGNAMSAHCAVCEKERTFKDVLAYRYAHIWYLFRWVTKKSYYTVCEICGRGKEHVSKAYESAHGKSAIPAFDRFGGWLLAALIAGVVVLAVVAGRQSDEREASLLLQPQVGDLYSARVDKFTDGFDGLTYGIMRVASVDGQSVALEIPNSGYNKMKGVNRDLRGAEPRKAEYYSGETVSVPRSELAQRHDGGDIYDVTR